MNKLILLGAFCAATSISAIGAENNSGELTPPEPATVLCGIMVSNDEWSDLSQAGVYTVEVKPEGAIKCIHRSSDMANTAAGLLNGGIMYTVTATPEGKYYYNKYSPSDWSRKSREEIDVQNVPADLCYDPVTKKVYGAFWDSEYNGFSIIGSFGLNDAERTRLKGTWDERDYHAFAATPDGTVYTIKSSLGYLYTVNVTNRSESTPITNPVGDNLGRTGLRPDCSLTKGLVCSMTYDEANDRLLAIIPQSEGWGGNKVEWTSLVEINPYTAETTEIRRMPGNACFAGIYVTESVTDPMAPATLTNIAVTPKSDNPLAGTISFTVPSTTFGGAKLAEDVMAVVKINGKQNVYGYFSAGQTVEIPAEFTEGDNTIEVTLCTDQLRGESFTTGFYAGEDAPMSVTNVRVNIDNGMATLTWDAPAGGANGGAIIPANITYTVTRMPDKKVIAKGISTTSVTDSSLPQNHRAIYYTVKASNSKGDAEAVESNRVPTAGAFSIPFIEGFASADDFALWTVVDPNGGPCWAYRNGQADYLNNPGLIEGNDWLISPPIYLEEGKAYKIRYEYRTGGYKKAENFEIKAGTELNPEALTLEIANHVGVTNTTYTAAEAAFTATSTGKWYFGIHYYGPASNYELLIDNISVTEFDGRVPAQVSDLSVTPSVPGALTVSVGFTVPVTDADGNELASVSKAEVYREDLSETSPLKTFTSITPGQELAFDDTVNKAGIYTYSVRVYNATEAGIAASQSIFIGEDRPAAPTDLTVTELNGHPVVSWQAPAKGDNGGWYDPEKLTYTVYRDAKEVGKNITGTSFTDISYTIPTNRQDAISYIVISCYDGVTSRGAQTDATVVGTPYKAPVSETFPEADMSYYPWLAQSFMSPTYAWTLETSGIDPVVADSNGDRGVACFHAVGEIDGIVSYFYSPKFDISGLTSPMLSYAMYHTPSIAGNGSMQVMISVGGGEFVAVGEPILRTEGEVNGWVRHLVDLSDYASATDLRIGFAGTGDTAANIFIDDIKIDNIIRQDAAIINISAPTRVAAGQTFPIEVTVENVGLEDLSELSLKLNVNETISTCRGIELKAGESAVISFESAISSEGTTEINVTLEGDENSVNNSAEVNIKIVTPVIPGVSGLEATVSDEGVTLTWKEPKEKGAVTDDVESYKDWAIDNIGEWTMFDGDYAPTWYINKDLGEYPDATTRKAFQICNASTLGIDIWEQGKTHSGNKMFMAMASNGYVNNDWLISPRLNGTEQWISFFARSFTLDEVPAERMRVWYSMTDTDPVHFFELTTNYIELGETWQEYRFLLPAGARYFAINCVSDDAFAMFVDDLCFNDMTVPVWTLTGYEVALNGQTVATVTEPTFTAVSGNSGKYAVRPVYAEGTGGFCEPVEVVKSSISDDAASAISVYTHAGNIIVKGAEGEITVNDVAGRQFITRDSTIAVAPGVYIVKVNGQIFKVAVK